MMKAISCWLLCIVCLEKPSYSQYYYYDDLHYDASVNWEFGLGAGGMNCFTDLGGRKGTGKGFMKDLNLSNTRLCASAYLEALYHYTIGGRLEFTYGSVTAYDSILGPGGGADGGRYQRNLSFRSKILELSLLAEFHPLACHAYSNGLTLPRFSPYLVGGIGLFTFDPKAKLNNNWLSLNDLHTEGQGFVQYTGRKPYKLTQCNVPVGVGVKYEVSTLLNARLEIVHRLLFTDYLDDVSTSYINPEAFYTNLPPAEAALATQLADRRRSPNHADDSKGSGIRGNPGKKDTYFSVQLKFGLLLSRVRKN
jgi:hypothetical protein